MPFGIASVSVDPERGDARLALGHSRCTLKSEGALGGAPAMARLLRGRSVHLGVLPDQLIRGPLDEGAFMAANPADLVVMDLQERYGAEAPPPAMARLYEDDTQLGQIFAVLQGHLNSHFDGINGRATSTHHYWADPSRQLLGLIKDVNQVLFDLNRVGFEVSLDERYQSALERCEPWLSPSGGSTVPDEFTLIEVLRHEAAFSRPTDTVKLKKSTDVLKLKMVGEGSYAHVYSYRDPDYGILFAIKRAKPGITDRDLLRFRQEYEVMKRLSFPYILEVYQFDAERNEYRMEYCEETLRSHIGKRNASPAFSFGSRKRIALQLLYAVNYIHSEGYLHRDLSLQNVLLKVYDSGAVLVKLSDFGLVKDEASVMTRTHTEMKGTIRDPLLDSLKDFTAVHEMYAIGFLLSFIFTGRESLAKTGDVGRIAQKCTSFDLAERYQTVADLIADVEALDAVTTEAPA